MTSFKKIPTLLSFLLTLAVSACNFSSPLEASSLNKQSSSESSPNISSVPNSSSAFSSNTHVHTFANEWSHDEQTH